DPLTHRNTHVDKRPPTDQVTAAVRAPAPGDLEILQEVVDHLSQSIQILIQTPAPSRQRQNRIELNLAGKMQKRSAASTDPLHSPKPGFQFRGLKANVLAASLAANRDNGPELVKKNGATLAVAGDLMSQAPLDGQRAIPVQRAKQVRLQCALFYLKSP